MTDLLLPFINQKIEEARRKLEEKQPHEIWITELVECQKKAHFRLAMPEFNLPNPATITGEFVHKGILAWLKHYYEARTEVEMEKELGGWLFKGRIDAILDDGTVVEVKFMRSSVERAPLEHHLEQLRLYLWLTGLEKGVLLYVTPEAVYEHVITTPFKDEQVIALLQDKRTPKYDWECGYCNWSSFCEKKVRRERR